jgi:predicted transcriptional regulator of viral defense system
MPFAQYGLHYSFDALDDLLRERDVLRDKDIRSRRIHRLYVGMHRRLEKIGRGLYVDAEAAVAPEVIASVVMPNAFVCLESAAFLHGLLDHRPPRVWMAIGHRARIPKRPELAIACARFSPRMLTLGSTPLVLERHCISTFCVEKTLADCFHFHRRIGFVQCQQMLDRALSLQKTNADRLLPFIEARRVRGIYESLLHHIALGPRPRPDP